MILLLRMSSMCGLILPHHPTVPAFNPSPANVNQDDLLLKHMEAHYRRVTSAKGALNTAVKPLIVNPPR